MLKTERCGIREARCLEEHVRCEQAAAVEKELQQAQRLSVCDAHRSADRPAVERLR